MSPELAKELIGFVDQSVKTILIERSDFPAEVTSELAEIVKRRKIFADRMANSPEERVLSYLREGKLDDEVIGDALAVRDKEFIIVALSALLKSPKPNIQTVFDMKNSESYRRPMLESRIFNAHLPQTPARGGAKCRIKN